MTSASAFGGFVSSDIEAGTRFLFQQTNAPVGWTKDTSAGLDDTALRLVTGNIGSGGSSPFSTVFANDKSINSTTLSTSQLPSHDHYADNALDTDDIRNDLDATPNDLGIASGYNSVSVSSTGGDGSHTHTNLDVRVNYVDLIIASKD